MLQDEVVLVDECEKSLLLLMICAEYLVAQIVVPVRLVWFVQMFSASVLNVWLLVLVLQKVSKQHQMNVMVLEVVELLVVMVEAMAVL